MKRQTWSVVLAVVLLAGFLGCTKKEEKAKEDKTGAEGWARVVEASGEVGINGAPAKAGDTANMGDAITTGKDSRALLKLADGSALLLRPSTRVVLEADEKPGRLALLAGGVLAVFADDGPHEIKGTTAVAGVRGTGMFAKIDEGNSNYFCTCFGTVEYISSIDESTRETVTADHHHGLRVGIEDGKPVIAPAGMEDHTDEELGRLKAVVAEPF